MQLQQLTGVIEKCLIQHATSTFACPLCEFRVTKVENLFITTALFSRNTKVHEKSHVKQPTQDNRKYFKHRHGIWICPWYAFTFLVSTYKCVHNFQSILYKLVDWRALKLLIKIQPDATECRYLFTAKSLLHVSGVTAPIIRSTKNCNRSLRYRSQYWYRYFPSVFVLFI